MLKDLVEKEADELSQTFEEASNTLNLSARIQLTRYMSDKNYLQKQLRSQSKFKLRLFEIAKKELIAINRKYDKVYSTTLKKADLKENKEAINRLKEIKLFNAQAMTILSNNIYNAYQSWISKVKQDVSLNGRIEIGQLVETQDVYNSISRVLNDKSANEEIGVIYSNGARHSFKGYMEMKARTTLNQEVGKQQMESAVAMGDVFWLCNSFEDCRPTHLDYQGKVYYDERYLSMGFSEEQIQEIEKAIIERNMMSRQEVENADPYLGNCPNCRHEFVAVPIDDVISKSNKELLKENNFNVDRASEEKYNKAQEQRLYERKIRDYKFKIEQDKMLLDKTPSGVSDQVTEKSLNHNKAMLKRYRNKMIELVNNNDYLERNYERENVKILSEDLGYRTRNKKR